MEDLLKTFEENPGLAREAEALWASDTSAQEIAEMLNKNGVTAEPSKVEEILALLQEKRAKTIGNSEKVDREQLAKIAGGGQGLDCSGAGDCDTNFKDESYWKKERCRMDRYCDEYYGQIPNTGSSW